MRPHWKRLDNLIMPLMITDKQGRILYKNSLARELDIPRVGSDLTKQLPDIAKENYLDLLNSGAIWEVKGNYQSQRCLAFSFKEGKEVYVALFFPGILLDRWNDSDICCNLIKMVPSLREMMMGIDSLPCALGKSTGRKSANLHVTSLLRKMLDVYLSDPREKEERSVDIGYFLSVFSYFSRNVFQYQGVELKVREMPVECGYLFCEHRRLAAELVMMIELLIDRTGCRSIYFDVDSEADKAVVVISAELNEEWRMLRAQLPDSYILFELLRQSGPEALPGLPGRVQGAKHRGQHRCLRL